MLNFVRRNIYRCPPDVKTLAYTSLIWPQFGLRGNVLEWFRSYLSDRTFRVVYGGNTSCTVVIFCSVPQGSVLGPRLFILYIADLADEIDQHGVNFHAYADDSQLYVHCNRVDTASTVTRLERCIADIGHWMSANRLKLNADKTELLWTGTKHSLSLLGGSGPDLRLGVDMVTASEHVRLLGVTISSDLSLDKHVNNVCAAGFFRLRQLRRVRRSLDPVSAACDTRPRFRVVPRRLLQRDFRRGVEDHNRQAATCIERCCTCCQ